MHARVPDPRSNKRSPRRRRLAVVQGIGAVPPRPHPRPVHEAGGPVLDGAGHPRRGGGPAPGGGERGGARPPPAPRRPPARARPLCPPARPPPRRPPPPPAP